MRVALALSALLAAAPAYAAEPARGLPVSLSPVSMFMQADYVVKGVMLTLVAWGALADFLKDVAITAGPAIAAQTGFSAWQREAIAFAFQFGSLILPAVAPAVLWVALHGRFLSALRERPAPNRLDR